MSSSNTYTKTILITGGTAGLGHHAALSLARARPDNLIILASRTDRTSAATNINTTLSRSNTLFLPLDLSSQSNIRTFAATWAENNYPPIETLLLNAGLQFPAKAASYTTDGIESTFGINHVGHALLFHLLTPHLSPTARIVLTSSGTHDPAQKTGMPDATYTSAEALAHPGPEELAFPGRKRYTQSKLAVLLWGYALHRRLSSIPGNQRTVVSFDPGMMPGTGLAREASAVEKMLWNRVMPRVIPVMRCVMFPNIHTPGESGGNLAWVALGEEGEAKGSSGVYFEGRKVIKSSVDSYDEGKQEDLWGWTVNNVAKDEEEKRKFDAMIGSE